MSASVGRDVGQDFRSVLADSIDSLPRQSRIQSRSSSPGLVVGQSHASFADHSERKEMEVDEAEKKRTGKDEIGRAFEEEEKGEFEGRRSERIDGEKKQKERKNMETGFEGMEHLRPTYLKVHRTLISRETLDIFELPWEPSKDAEYLIIKRWINEQWQNQLFKHTDKLRRKRAKELAVEEDANLSHSSEAPSIHDDHIPGPERLEEESRRGNRVPSRKASHSSIGSTHSKPRSKQRPLPFSEASFDIDESTDAEADEDVKRILRTKRVHGLSRPEDRRARRFPPSVDSLYDAFQHPKFDDLCSFLEEEQIKSRIRDLERRERELGCEYTLTNDKEFFEELNEVAKPFLETLAVRMEADEGETLDDAISLTKKLQENYNIPFEPQPCQSVPSVDIEKSAAPNPLSSSPLFALLLGQEVSRHNTHTVDRPDPGSELHPTESTKARASRIFRITHRIQRWFAFCTLGRDVDRDIDVQPALPLGNDAEDHLVNGAKQVPCNTIRNYAVELDVREPGEALSPHLFNLQTCERKGAGFRASCCTCGEASQRFNEGIVNDICMRQYLNEAEQLRVSRGLRCIYVEDDRNSFVQVMQRYNLLTRHFGCSFSKWALGIVNAKDSQAAKRTFSLLPFWNFRKTVAHSAFGWDYLSPSNTPVNQTKPPKPYDAAESLLNSSKIEESSFVYRRCSIYIRQRTESSSDDSSDESSDDSSDESSVDSPNKNPKVSSESNILMDTTIIAVDFGSEPSTSACLFPTPRKIQKYACCERKNGNNREVIASLLQGILRNLFQSWIVFVDAKLEVVHGLQELVMQEPASADIEILLWDLSLEITKALSLLDEHRNLSRSIYFISFEGYDFPSARELNAVRDTIESQLKRPIREMIDLVYKSISIRDARRSLQLNTSLWRLSWIAFIFLPLAWLCGFFGMNVSTFHSDPSSVWYFVTAAPLICVVFLAWLATKRLLGPVVDERQRTSKMKTKLS